MLKSLFNKLIQSSLKKNSKYDGGKINLLIELNSFDKGGLEKVVLDLAIGLSKTEFLVTIVSVNKTGYLAQIARENGIEVIGLSGVNKNKQYKEILIDKKIHLTNSHFSSFGYELFSGLGIPNITFIHNIYAFMSTSQIAEFLINDKYVHKYISVSPKATRYAELNLKVDPLKIVTIPNGLNISEHDERIRKNKAIDRAQFGLKNDDYVFLNPASYNLHKGHYLMADAMMRVVKINPKIKILCVGNIVYKPHFDGFKEYLKDVGLMDNILMPGYYERIEDIYPMCDAFILPSFIEGWSIAMNEAMYYERPMILTDVGGSSEVLQDNDIGILIPNEFGDVESLNSKLLDKLAYDTKKFKTSELLSDAILNFNNNKNYWSNQGKLGRHKIIERYNFLHVISKYENVFKELVHGHV